MRRCSTRSTPAPRWSARSSSSTTYTSFAREAVDYANRKGVLLSLDSNDFDSLDHSDGMLYDHAIPGNSLTQSPTGAPTQWFRARSDVTSYGPHNVFSGEGNSTSGATPFMAGMLAMVQSAALNARDRHVIPRELTPNEVRQVMMDTASPVIPQTQAPNVAGQWPGNPKSVTDTDHTNWSTQYGYGRPDIGAATALVMPGRVPPTAEISSPALVRVRRSGPPAQARRSAATSRASAWRSHGVRWTLEWALGEDPADSAFRTDRARLAARGTASWARWTCAGSRAGLRPRPRRRRCRRTGPSSTRSRCGCGRLDGNGLKAEDRRAFAARHDPDLLAGYPRLDRVGDERRAHLRPPRGASPARSRLRHLRRRGLRAAPERQGGARVPRPHARRSPTHPEIFRATCVQRATGG